MPNRAERRAAERAASQAQSNASSEASKATVSENRRVHIPAKGAFFIQDEQLYDYTQLAARVYDEYNPRTDTEARLADAIIQHYWLMQRAIRLQNENVGDDKKLALFLRYQTTHERSYYKAMKELKAIKKEEIGFESQNAKTRLTHARAENLEIDTACRKVMEVPLPGNYRISFEQIAHACSIGISALVTQHQNQEHAQAAI
jgi:hypothetical protein